MLVVVIPAFSSVVYFHFFDALFIILRSVLQCPEVCVTHRTQKCPQVIPNNFISANMLRFVDVSFFAHTYGSW